MKKYLLDGTPRTGHKSKRSKHDQCINDLVHRLEQSYDAEGNKTYDNIMVNTEFHSYEHPHVTAGEIDVYAERIGNNGRLYSLYFEVKSCNNPRNRHKAHFQLSREVRILSEGERHFEFYVTPDVIEWYRR